MDTVLTWFRPTIDAFFSPLPFRYRWRLLCFQPCAILIYFLSSLPWLFSRRFVTFFIHARSNHKFRALLFKPPDQGKDSRLRPIHLDLHAGGFIGGISEANARFCSVLAERTGAIVISASYRFAPRYPFPAAVDDVEDIVYWILQNAETLFGGDPKLLTIGGASAGGSLALAACQQFRSPDIAYAAIKGVLTFYAPVDLRKAPGEKQRPPIAPKVDILSWMYPLFDSYARSSPAYSDANPRLHPVLADINALPDDMLFIVPTIDIIVQEQLMFAERLKQDIENLGPEGKRRKVETLVFENCVHGWLELPSFAIKEETRTKAFNASCDFVRQIHEKHGFVLEC